MACPDWSKSITDALAPSVAGWSSWKSRACLIFENIWVDLLYQGCKSLGWQIGSGRAVPASKFKWTGPGRSGPNFSWAGPFRPKISAGRAGPFFAKIPRRFREYSSFLGRAVTARNLVGPGPRIYNPEQICSEELISNRTVLKSFRKCFILEKKQ